MLSRAFLVVFTAWIWATISFAQEAAAADAPVSLVSNPDFKLDAKDAGWPDGWPHPDGATWEKDGDERFIRLTAKPGQMVMLFREVKLPTPPPAAIRVRIRARHADIKPGEKAWYDGRVISHFKDAEGKVLKPEPAAPNFRGTSKGWVEKELIVKVPRAARTFELMPCLFQAASGTLDLGRLEVLTATADQLLKPPPIVPSTTMAITIDAAKLPAELHVDGTDLKTPDGRIIWLQGLCVDSLQWNAKGEKIERSVPAAVGQWKANVIRLPVTEEFWFGRNKTQKDSGLAYRKIVDSAISFHPKTAPMVISDWEYTPTQYWGASVKEALGGKLFQMKEPR